MFASRLLESTSPFFPLRSPEGAEGGGGTSSGDASGGGGGSSTQQQSSPPVVPGQSSQSSEGFAASSPSEESGDDAFSGYEEFSSEDDIDFSSVTAELPAAASAPPAAIPADPSVVVTPPAAPVQQQPPAQEQQQPTQQAPQQEADAPLRPFHENPVAFLKQLDIHREKLVEALAKEQFAMSEDEVIAFEDNPTEALSKLAAKVYFHSVSAMMARMSQLVPEMIRAQNQAQLAANAGEEFFFSRWPQLDRGKHSAEVIRIGRAYREANPKATAEQFTNDVGLIVSAQLGLLNSAGGNPPQKPNLNQGGFRPMVNGGGVSIGGPNAGHNPPPGEEWAGLGMDFD